MNGAQNGEIWSRARIESERRAKLARIVLKRRAKIGQNSFDKGRAINIGGAWTQHRRHKIVQA